MDDVEVIVGAPDDFTEIGGNAGMSNFDFAVNGGIEEQLRSEPTWTRYAGWNFNGRVWFADGVFWCQVWVYGTPRATFSADTLHDLMHLVSDQYGYE